MDELYGEFFRSIHQFTRLRMNEIFGTVSKGDFLILVTIADGNRNNGGITTSEIAERIHVLAPAVSRSLKSLEDRELIERIIRKSDRRNTYVILTPKGEVILHEVKQAMADFMKSVAEQLEEDNIKQLVKNLDRLYVVCEKEIGLRKERKKQDE